MVIRTRIRAVVIPLLLYAVSGSAAAYFVWHAKNGERGLQAKESYLRKTAELEAEFGALRAERKMWEMRVSHMRPEGVDRDMLEEEARIVLNRVDKRELVIFVPPAKN